MAALEPVLETSAATAAGTAEHRVRRSTVEVVVTVGTDHHRFDRLITWIDEWRDHHPDVSAVVQAGKSTPSRHGSRELIPHGELLDLFRGAAAVVSHGGPSTVMDARMSGRLPIVVARNPAYNEHVDQHQMRFAAHLDRHGVAVVVNSREGLFAALERALADPAAFAVTADRGSAIGVRLFARAVDELIGTRTPISSAPPRRSGPASAPPVERRKRRS